MVQKYFKLKIKVTSEKIPIKLKQTLYKTIKTKTKF